MDSQGNNENLGVWGTPPQDGFGNPPNLNGWGDRPSDILQNPVSEPIDVPDGGDSIVETVVEFLGNLFS